MKRICVFAGSSPGARAEYTDAARDLAQALIARHLGLVYGGGDVGLMGVIADTVLELGGDVVGVIPRALVDREVAHHRLTELRVVASMHDRKAQMEELSDGFVVLPGGFGTLEESLEILTWSQLGIHSKPCGLLNVVGYYDTLLQFLDQTVDAEFLKPENRNLVLVDGSASDLLDQFEKYDPPKVRKWVDSNQT
jgi:uncharacterized protein (TIGR00730 family)